LISWEVEMTIDCVRTGRFFVNEKKGVVREITADTLDGNVYWRSYELADGRPTGDSLMCSRERILRWADREATAEEVARLRREAAEAGEIARLKDVAARILAGVPTEMLLAELHRRGFGPGGDGST
jgi:hypothetical protein